jgi:hypothetical protein
MLPEDLHHDSQINHEFSTETANVKQGITNSSPKEL